MQERRLFDEKFVKMETKKLCELTSAADSLEMRPLVDMASRALARLIEGKSPEEIREAFNLPDDLTEEEKLEPVKNLIDDPRIRLLNRLYAKKRKVCMGCMSRAPCGQRDMTDPWQVDMHPHVADQSNGHSHRSCPWLGR